MFRILCAALGILSIPPAHANAHDWPSAAGPIFMQVVSDPTTFVPSITSYTAERLDRPFLLRHPRREKLIRTIGWRTVRFAEDIYLHDARLEKELAGRQPEVVPLSP